MRKLALILFVLFPLLGISQETKFEKAQKDEDPFALSISATPGLTKLGPPFSSIFSYDLNARFGYFIKENIWSSVGLGYSRKSFKQDLGNIHSTAEPIVTSTLDYFEFPLSIHYRTGDFNRVTHDTKKHRGHQAKVGFTASAGVIPGILWDGKYDYSGSAGTDHQASKETLKSAGYKSIVSVSGSAGIYYHLSHHVFMTVEPEFKYCISQVPRGSNYHWSSIGFKISFWYRIMPAFGV